MHIGSAVSNVRYFICLARRFFHSVIFFATSSPYFCNLYSKTVCRIVCCSLKTSGWPPGASWVSGFSLFRRPYQSFCWIGRGRGAYLFWALSQYCMTWRFSSLSRLYDFGFYDSFWSLNQSVITPVGACGVYCPFGLYHLKTCSAKSTSQMVTFVAGKLRRYFSVVAAPAFHQLAYFIKGLEFTE